MLLSHHGWSLWNRETYIFFKGPTCRQHLCWERRPLSRRQGRVRWAAQDAPSEAGVGGQAGSRRQSSPGTSTSRPGTWSVPPSCVPQCGVV